MPDVTKEDRDLAWAILDDLSDRAGIPEWLGRRFDDAARDVAKDVAQIIAEHRTNAARSTKGATDK